jgi:hypothetical protein
MDERVLRSNPDKTNLWPPLSSNKRENPTFEQLSPSSEFLQQSSSSTMELNSSASTATITSDLQMVMQMLHKMQVDANNGAQEMKKELNSRIDQVNKEVEHLRAKIEQGESNHVREMKNIQDQVDASKVVNSTTTVITDQPASNGNGRNTAPQVVESGSMAHMQSQNLLRMVLDKQIDELKPYYGKKQENVDVWIKKIDKLAEIARMPDEEIFMLAKLKLQGDGYDWTTWKDKQIGTGSASSSSTAESERTCNEVLERHDESLFYIRREHVNTGSGLADFQWSVT